MFQCVTSIAFVRFQSLETLLEPRPTSILGLALVAFIFLLYKNGRNYLLLFL